MTARGTITTPELEAANAFEQSPAQDALQSNLDTSLTLNRKKSGWFGSAREAVARGAAHAKGYVDSLRGSSPVKPEQDAGSPVRGPGNVLTEHHSFSPRKAMNTFRQHVQLSGSKARQRRGALADLHGSIAHGDGPHGPEIYTQSDGTVASPTGHGKKIGLGRNLVGSIRSLTSKHTRSPPRMGDKENHPPASLPISSSPTVPLILDLGSSLELLPQGFGRVSKLAAGEMSPTLTRLAPDLIPQMPARPIVQLEDMTEEDTDTSIVESILETETSGEDPSEMFERSVDTKGKSLKRMISLDAMAERCIQSADRKSPRGLIVSKQCSVTTVSTCPSDMQEITRQPTRMQMPMVLLDNQVDGKWRSDDPFAPTPPSIRVHGPETVLPFRPKAVPQKFDEEDKVVLADSSASLGQQMITSAAKHRSMVSEVLEIAGSDEDIDLAAVFGVDNAEGDCSLYGPVYGEFDPSSEPKNRTSCTEEDSRGSHGAARDQREEFVSDPETALQEAILDNYDLQVALGGVDITCDDQPLHWAGQDNECQKENTPIEVISGEDILREDVQEEDYQEEDTHEEDLGEEESASSDDSGTKSPRYELLLGPDALSKSATKIHDYEVLLDQIGSDTSRESISELSRDGEGSLKEAIDMYRSYSAEHGGGVVEELLAAVDVPTSPVWEASSSSVKRKPVPSRYHVRHW